MQYRLGIDVGTASVGAVALELEHDEPKGIAWHAVRIFSEPLDSTQTGLKARSGERRVARLQRRQVERRARRLRRIAELLRLLGGQWQSREKTSHEHLSELRARAAREKIESWEFGCVLLRMAKRRGYSGGFRDAEGGVVKASSERLQQLMDTLAVDLGLESVTLGEYLWHRQQNGLPVYLKADRGIPNNEPLYALREMLQYEFGQLWTVQERFHPELQGSYLGRPWRLWFQDALFYQRPLKSVSDMVGNCLLEPNLPRAPRAHMATQCFRIEKTLHDLRWGGGRRAERLSKEQLDLVRDLLLQPANDKALVSFKQIVKALDEAGLNDLNGRSLNLENGGRDSLTGNRTLAVWRKLGLLENWQQLGSREQTTVINLLADLGSPELLLQPDWHLKMPKACPGKNDPNPYRTFSPSVVDFINRLCLQSNDKGEPVYDRFSTMGFENGRSSYSVKALERLNRWFAEPWWPDSGPGAERCGQIDEEAALRVCYPHLYAAERQRVPVLDVPPVTGNAVVDVALRQLRRVINQCIDALGSPPQEIIIEMGREVGRGVEWRNEQSRRMRDNEQGRRKWKNSGWGAVPHAFCAISYGRSRSNNGARIVAIQSAWRLPSQG